MGRMEGTTMSKCYLQGLGEGYGRLPDRTDALPTGLPECATARPAGETSKDVGLQGIQAVKRESPNTGTEMDI